jgi:hypothetical protein
VVEPQANTMKQFKKYLFWFWLVATVHAAAAYYWIFYRP